MEKLRLEEPEQKATLSDKLKDGVKSLFSIFKKDNTIKFKTSEEALGEIFKLMVELENERKDECKDTMCPAVISNDKSCSAIKAVCKNSICELAY